MSLNYIFLAFSVIIVSGQKTEKECQWNGTVTSLENGCTKIRAETMEITGPNQLNILNSKFSQLEEIIGCVRIVGTDYENFSFFARLRSVRCANISHSVDFMISNNSALSRLGMPVLNVNRLGLTFNPKLCLTREETTRYTNVQRGSSDNITFCQGMNGNIKECRSAVNSLNGGLDDNCEIVIGNLYIEGNNNPNISNKLQFMKEINGRLFIRSTNINNLSFPLLEKIYAADEMPTTRNEPNIYIEKNINFTKLEMPKIVFMTPNVYALESNDSNYVVDSTLCNKLSPFGIVKSNHTVCVSSNGQRRHYLKVIIISVIFIVFL